MKSIIKKAVLFILGPFARIRLKARLLPGREGFLYKMGVAMDMYAYSRMLKHLGENSIIHPSVDIRGPGMISVGSFTSINHGTELHGHGGIFIGDNTLISYKVMVLSDMREFKNQALMGSQPKRKMPVCIGNDVWVGASVTILPAVTIEDHAIIGAGAVVTKDVKAWDIVAGNPAKIIGSRMD